MMRTPNPHPSMDNENKNQKYIFLYNDQLSSTRKFNPSVTIAIAESI